MPFIYIVEDDVNIREIQRYALRNSGFEVQEFGCGRELYQAIRQRAPSLILLDIMLPGEDGLEILKNLRSDRATAKVPVIMLTAKSTELDKVKGLDLGADDYMTKPFSMVLLGKRITALLRRSGQAPLPQTITFGDVTVDFSGYTASDSAGKIDIMPKEIDLLRLLVEHKGLVLTRSQILDELWGADYPIIDRTVDTYIKNLRKKLRLDCIVTVKGIGYKYEVQP